VFGEHRSASTLNCAQLANFLTTDLLFQVVASADIVSFTFIGHSFVLMSVLTSRHIESEGPALLLYSLDKSPDRSKDHVDTHLLCFLFQTCWGGSVIRLTSDPSPEWSSSPRLQVPFQTASDDQIIVLHRRFHRARTSQTFLIPASTLLEHVNNTPIGGEGRDVEWKSWRLQCSAEPAPSHGTWTVWQCFVFRMRYISPGVKLLNDKPVIVVRDLCPQRYLRASREEREESDAIQREIFWHGPYSRSIVKCVPVPRGIQALSGIHLMISEDSIVILEVRCRQPCVFMAARLMLLGCRPILSLAKDWFICSHSDNHRE
jgi:hypothetical protein